MASLRTVLSRVGTVVFILGALGLGSLVLWNLFGQGPYASSCSYSLGCKSFYCVHHELHGDSQWTSPKGMCTKSCDTDMECGKDAKCVALSDETKDDLPPFGKPDKACLNVAPAAEQRH